MPLRLPESSEDGWIDYSHQLERRPVGAANANWDYVGHVQSNLKEEEEYDCDESDPWDYPEDSDPEDDQ